MNDYRKKCDVGCILETLEKGIEGQKMLADNLQDTLCRCLQKMSENGYKIIPMADGFTLKSTYDEGVSVEVFGKDKAKMFRLTKYLLLGRAIEQLLGGNIKFTFSEGDKYHTF